MLINARKDYILVFLDHFGKHSCFFLSLDLEFLILAFFSLFKSSNFELDLLDLLLTLILNGSYSHLSLK